MSRYGTFKPCSHGWQFTILADRAQAVIFALFAGIAKTLEAHCGSLHDLSKPEPALSLEDMKRKARSAISRLTGKQRQAIELAYVLQLAITPNRLTWRLQGNRI
jgi:hypothetical protein